MTQAFPGPDVITPEQILWLRDLPNPLAAPFNLRDLCDIALGARFPPAERADARRTLALVFLANGGPNGPTSSLGSLLTQLAAWVTARRPASSEDEFLVRAFFDWHRTTQ